MSVQQTRKRIGHRIKVRRVELDLKQEDLAQRVGVPQTQISGWENGNRAMRVEQLLELAWALKTTVAYLVGESERREWHAA